MKRPANVKPATVRKFWGEDTVRGVMVNTVGDELWCTNSYLAMPVDLFPGLLDTFKAANLEPAPGMYLCDADGMTKTASTPPLIEPLIVAADFSNQVRPVRLANLERNLLVSDVVDDLVMLFEIGGEPFGLSTKWLQWFEPFEADEIRGSGPTKPVLFHRTTPDGVDKAGKPKSITRRLGVLMPVRLT